MAQGAIECTTEEGIIPTIKVLNDLGRQTYGLAAASGGSSPGLERLWTSPAGHFPRPETPPPAPRTPAESHAVHSILLAAAHVTQSPARPFNTT